MATITISKKSVMTELTFEPGELLSDVLLRGGYPLSLPCGGHGICGRCLVTLADGQRIPACHTPAQNGMHVILEEDAVSLRILHPAGEGPLGVAVDLGTTTVVLQLLSLAEGLPVARIEAMNIQSFAGADVISRCEWIMNHENGVPVLQHAIHHQIAGLLRRLCEELQISESRVQRGTLAGNTVMEHIFAGLDPSGMAVAPFTPVTLFREPCSVSLSGFHDLPIELLPCLSPMIGGDVVGGLASTSLPEDEKPGILIDVGTNGEMMLGSSAGFISCSTATGPAFEGSGISCGTTYGDGVIHHLTFDRVWKPEANGSGSLHGICGSGLADFLSESRRAGFLDESGRIPASPPPLLRPYIRRTDKDVRVRISGNVFVTDADVRRLQLAKAAVRAGTDILLAEAGLTPGDVDRVLIAGGFGSGLRPSSVTGMGMLPREWENKMTFVGNSSLEGASRCLAEPDFRHRVAALCRNSSNVQLSGNPAFEDAFVKAMSF